MQKKLAFLLNVALLGGLTNSLKADNEIKKIAILGSLASIGAGAYHLDNLNKEYSKKNKKPDLQMRLIKAATAAGSILAVDVLTDDTSTTKQHLAKIGVAFIAMAATTKPVADTLRPIPLLGGLLTDPIDEDGDERKDIGAIARFALAYIPLRQAVVHFFPNTASRK